MRDPAWLTHFRLHHRQARSYRKGRVFVAGDAGHIHSPVGAQGMNTGIQDAWNLGWKLALVASGVADPRLLDSYEAERWPVGHALLQYTDRIFSVFVRGMSSNALATWLRRTVVARVLPVVLSSERVRSLAFRFVSELGIRYQRSPAVTEGRPRLSRGPRAGDRLPDAQLTRDDRPTYLQQELVGPRFHLLLCGPVDAWDGTEVSALATRYTGLLVVRHLTRGPAHGPQRTIIDAVGDAHERLGVTAAGAAQYLVRPDGYIGFRCGGTDLRAATRYLEHWIRSPA